MQSAGLFFTGTDTGVGKTYVAALAARALVRAGRRVGVYKPVASGCREVAGELISDDAVALWEAAGWPGELERVCPQRFAAPLAPHLAARAEGRQVDPAMLRQGLRYWQERFEVVLVEGAGGLLSPVTETEYVADLAVDLGYPLVVVARNALGTINHTLLTLEAARRRGLTIAALVLNDVSHRRDDASLRSNAAELAARSGVALVARVRVESDEFEPPIDWFAAGSA